MKESFVLDVLYRKGGFRALSINQEIFSVKPSELDLEIIKDKYKENEDKVVGFSIFELKDVKEVEKYGNPLNMGLKKDNIENFKYISLDKDMENCLYIEDFCSISKYKNVEAFVLKKGDCLDFLIKNTIDINDSYRLQKFLNSWNDDEYLIGFGTVFSSGSYHTKGFYVINNEDGITFLTLTNEIFIGTSDMKTCQNIIKVKKDFFNDNFETINVKVSGAKKDFSSVQI